MTFTKDNVPWNKGIPRSEQTKKKMSETKKSRFHNDVKFRDKLRRTAHDPQRRRKLSLALKNREITWASKISESMQGKTLSQEHRQHISEGVTKAHAEGRLDSTTNMLGKTQSDHQKAVMSRVMSRLWKTKSYKQKIQQSRIQHPNNLEKQFQQFLDNYNLPFCYNEKSFIIGNKLRVPDFIASDGSNKIIELFGDFWHDPDDVAKQDFYKQHGYHCLIIWEHELSDPESVKEKIVAWMGASEID